MLSIFKQEKKSTGQPVAEVIEMSQSIDRLLQTACSLGGLRVYQYEKGRHFTVTISFKRKAGSEIEAKGSNTSLSKALIDAIDEAVELGAKP